MGCRPAAPAWSAVGTSGPAVQSDRRPLKTRLPLRRLQGLALPGTALNRWGGDLGERDRFGRAVRPGAGNRDNVIRHASDSKSR
jgi:hypothetical protein